MRPRLLGDPGALAGRPRFPAIPPVERRVSRLAPPHARSLAARDCATGSSSSALKRPSRIANESAGYTTASTGGPTSAELALRGVKREHPQSQRLFQRGFIAQRAIKNRFPEARFADDQIRRAPRDFDPVALRIQQIQMRRFVLCQLAAHDAMKVEMKAGLDQPVVVLVVDAAYLFGQSVSRPGTSAKCGCRSVAAAPRNK